MKTQFSKFYAERKSMIIAALTTAFILFVPLGSLVYGLIFYSLAYLTTSLLAVYPALTMWQAMMIAVPFAVIRIVFSSMEYRTFGKKRKMLKDAFSRYQKLNALR